MRDATIEDYRWLYKHTDYMRRKPEYRWEHWAPRLAALVKGRCLVDFGAGRGDFAMWAALQGAAYCHTFDPIVEGATLPTDCSLVTSFDVLEHIELHQIEPVVQSLAQYPKQFHAIANMPDQARVADDERVNLHPIQQRSKWWVSLLNYLLKPKIIEVCPWKSASRFALYLEL